MEVLVVTTCEVLLGGRFINNIWSYDHVPMPTSISSEKNNFTKSLKKKKKKKKGEARALHTWCESRASAAKNAARADDGKTTGQRLGCMMG